MSAQSQRHAMVLHELVEWWEDLSRSGIGSRAVLVPVPSRWGRTTLLEQFAAIIGKDETVSIVVAISGISLPSGMGLQAQALRDLFHGASVSRRVAEVLGVDRMGGVVQLGLAVGGLFVSPLAALVGLLLAGVAVGATGKVWDNAPVGQEGTIARLARAVAAVSVSVPVVVIIDDGDRLDPGLAITLVENLIERADGQVLVVAAADPDSHLTSTLLSRARYGLTADRVLAAEADPDMGHLARADLAAELCPRLPAVASRRIGQRTRTFGDVFTVASMDLLTELDPADDDNAIVARVDEVIDARADRAPPSTEAVVLAWAGGVLHATQADRALAVLGAQRSGADEYVRRLESLVRLVDPASPRLAEQVRVLSTSTRRRLASAVLESAVRLGADPGVGLLERVVAWQAAHRVRADLDDRELLVGMQCQLVHGLETLDDPAAAYEVAATALAEYLASHSRDKAAREGEELSAAVLRLARTSTAHRNDPLIETTIASALAGGAAVGLEARVWTVIDLLDQPGKREIALKLVDEVTAELGARNDLGPLGDRWRLLLAFNVRRTGYPAVTQRLLTSMINTGTTDQQEAAQAVLYAVGGPGADTRLQIVGLEAELQALTATADDDRLRLHHALRAGYDSLGDYRSALSHGHEELALRGRIQGADHPDTLDTRSSIAVLTGRSGHAAKALRLAQELLPDQERVLGADHRSTLATRHNIAVWANESGHPEEALRLFEELLPDLLRVLGHDHPDSLSTRATITLLVGQYGDPVGALRLAQELLPDQERVLGLDHRDTLTNRNNIVYLTGRCGDWPWALRLARELLPDQERVLGPDHPDTLTTRGNIAYGTGQGGRPAEALRLSEELLPDKRRVLGPDHPGTLGIRSSIAYWTGRCGHLAEALRLFQELLPDQERVLGPGHPSARALRQQIQQLNAPSDSPDG